MLPPATKNGAASATAIQPMRGAAERDLGGDQRDHPGEGQRQAGGARGTEALHLQAERQEIGEERRKGEAKRNEARTDMRDRREGERVGQHAGEQARAEIIGERPPIEPRGLAAADRERGEDDA